MGNMVFGGEAITFQMAAIAFGGYVAAVFIVHAWATEYSLLRPRRIQIMLGSVLEPVRRAVFGRIISRQHLSRSLITPYFRVNGRPPETEEYKELLTNDFADWRLRIYGLVRDPLELSLHDLLAMPKKTQITEHSCIQGWTAIGEWGGVSVSEILKKCQPLPNARYAIFHSLGYGKRDEYGRGDPLREYYEVISLELANHDQTILAYDMNEERLTVPHGAPLRLRVETQLGYKMVKWLRSIELVDDYRKIGDGQGGYREDIQYYGIGAEM